LKKMKNIEIIRREIERVGCGHDDLGPCDSLTVRDNGDGTCTVGDDGAGVTGRPEEILAAFRTLPDNAGWELTWDAIREIE